MIFLKLKLLLDFSIIKKTCLFRYNGGVVFFIPDFTQNQPVYIYIFIYTFDAFIFSIINYFTESLIIAKFLTEVALI